MEEHRYTKDDADKNSIEKELFQAELIPEEPTELSFMEKFVELQIKMLVTNQENVQNHNYASDPIEWPFLTRGIAYFISKTSNVSQRNFYLSIFSFNFVSKILFPGSSSPARQHCHMVHLLKRSFGLHRIARILPTS